MNDTERHLDDIQADIQRTRSRLDETLSAVEQKLEPKQLVDQGWQYLRSHGATEYFASLGDAAKRQPLPLALIGTGLAWLMLSDGRRHLPSDNSLGGSSHVSPRTGSGLGQTTETVKQAVQNATNKLAETRDAATSTVADMGNRVSGAVAGTMEKVTHNAQRVKSGYEHMVEEQPLALGAIGLALGALLAATAPRTRQEDRMMGSTSDRLFNDAKKFGEEKVEQAKEAVKSTLSDVMPTDSSQDKKPAPSTGESHASAALLKPANPPVARPSDPYFAPASQPNSSGSGMEPRRPI